MSQDNATGAAAASTSNFLRQIIDTDLEQGTYAGRQDTAGHALPPIITRFPPEPNGYLHIGHAKSIWVNFGLAKEYGGRCHLRFDDTNPVKEDTEYVDSIIDAVHWLGYSWQNGTGEHLYYASDYFEQLYGFAEVLIQRGAAYIDSQSAEQIAANRGDFTRPGTPSPFRDRSVEENLALFRDMRAGKYQDGQHVLRARIDMAAPNIVMRDPVLYRIRHAHHHRTGDAWCIYPMYDFTHCISDALENITHSLCTLEFENNRPLYDWVLDHLRDAGALPAPLPHQYEFARLHLTYAITSKRKLLQLVNEKRVDGWDDPRMPTLVGIRRRGYTPESIQLFCERVGVSKADSWIDMSILEAAVRDDLDARAPRSVAVLDPVKLILDNVPADFNEPCSAPVHPKQPELGRREFPLTRELWIEREDFTETPPKGYFRLFPGNKVRLRYGYVIECTGCDKDADGNITAVHANIIPDTKSGTPGADSVKVKGNIHWVSAAHALEAEVRLYDRLFTDPQPDSGDKNFLDALNPDAKRVVTAYLEPTLATAKPEDRFQFERHGYFVADRIDSQPGKPVFNRVVGLKDSWGK
ncbi:MULTISPECIES: glutamine--tRNA ligase/YqeY domain fusion protein [Ralstonia solanacearum species complex]|uniref:Glutamine--tRNA ligase n=3 Tax=Ralstonia solanacearum species complex TaxID=3116862 RepID=SYQ_RALN1|nr:MULTISPECIES: glutamine--tRNA ligase/YqeY domain fusion protein [Ralstonia]Q8Y199.1 RecName: Full=Glutamine--tRNA ligase; AltName: Full=Glutaminyl-tRNA synthetase; Short=GlnRS [Ralstonia pseudosolanacearum GMI1000]AKZ27225.1 glutaminyl-tRNA synthetase [Ralstonia solanacearum]APC67871.1 glutamine--tRNA ligase [Ralstonia solanacearum OE1-1]APF87900.1 glutamine--tRNA ligase [Ralstonia solanacearum FJAT-1458]ARS55348.1 glutamine--tRNA ligase [Ralstonia solanacearum FJAT-91]ESS48608.1 glutaminy